MDIQHVEIKKIVTKKKPVAEHKKILLIDGDKDSALSAAVVREGYDIVHCDCVQKAWGRVYPHRPHLIILRLHGSSGVDLSDLQECRALAEGIPIILVIPAHVNRALIKAMQHGSAVIPAASPTPESITEVLHHLEVSAIRR